MILRAGAVSSARSSPLPRRVTGVAAGFAVAEGMASAVERVAAAPQLSDIAQGPAPLFFSAASPQEREVLQQFLADLAVAPEIAGELVALYVEQHPRFAFWFVARALSLRADSAAQIEAAARWREVCGATALAELIRAALGLAAPPAEPVFITPPVIVDIAYLGTDAPDDWIW